MLAVNAWNDKKDDIRGFVKHARLKQHILLNGASVAKKYGAKSVPTTLWIDRKGRIVDTELGFEGVASLESKTDRLLSLGS